MEDNKQQQGSRQREAGTKLWKSCIYWDNWTTAMEKAWFFFFFFCHHNFDLKVKKLTQDALPPTGEAIHRKQKQLGVRPDLWLCECQTPEPTQPRPTRLAPRLRLPSPPGKVCTVTVLIPAEPPKQSEQLTGVSQSLAFKKPRD